MIYHSTLDFRVQKPKQVGNDCSHETDRADLPSCACGNLQNLQKQHLVEPVGCQSHDLLGPPIGRDAYPSKPKSEKLQVLSVQATLSADLFHGMAL